MTLAVIIPCRNEALTIGKVVRDFREALPEAQIVVRDNGSGEISVRDGRYGLIGIQELLLEIGGELSIESEGLRRLTLIFPNPQFL